MFEDATTYMVKTCSKDCDVYKATPTRKCIWSPAPDDNFKYMWDKLKVLNEFRVTMSDKFTFPALSFEDCPYSSPPEASGWGGDGCFCVPNPGVTFEEIAGGHCQFRMEDSAQSALGEVAASSLQGLAASEFSGNAEETFGSWFGEVEEAAGAICVTGFCAFVIWWLQLLLSQAECSSAW